MPNAGSSLTGRCELFVCASHFNCEWVVSRGGRHPVAPPSVFLGLAKSYLKQSQPQQDAQLSQRDRAAGCVIVFAKSRILELGDDISQTL